MRTHHTAHALPGFPVYSSAFLSNNRLVLGGGGGVGRSGVKNRIRVYDVETEGMLHMLDELELQKDEDAPMSITVHQKRQEVVCGINSDTKQMEKGENKNCRVYSVMADKIALSKACGTFQSLNVEDYQKVATFSVNYDLLAVGSTNNEVAILSYPTLSPATRPIRLERGELHDIAFSPTSLVIVATTHLQVYSLSKTGKGKEKGKGKGKGKEKLLHLIDLAKVDAPSSPAQGMTFRAAQFHPTQSDILLTVLNASPPRTRHTKAAPRRGYICKWDTKEWRVTKLRKISEKGITCFDISSDGGLVAYGSSDCTVGILDSKTFGPLLTILKAHDFPPTTIKFNPDVSLLVSGSADNSVRVVVVPKNFENPWTIIIIILLSLLTLVIAFALKQ